MCDWDRSISLAATKRDGFPWEYWDARMKLSDEGNRYVTGAADADARLSMFGFVFAHDILCSTIGTLRSLGETAITGDGPPRAPARKNPVHVRTHERSGSAANISARTVSPSGMVGWPLQ